MMRRGLPAVLALAACTEPPEATSRAPVFERQVRAVLAARCDRCHATATPAGGWRSSRFTDVVACVAADGASAVSFDGGVRGAPMLRALDRPDHAGLVDAVERAVLEAWIVGGAQARDPGFHPVGIVDPRSPDFHARLLRGGRWSAMLEASSATACGRCHDGAPARPAAVTRSIPGATSCRACHEQPAGVLACDTCHGARGRADPQPGDCLAPARSRAAGAHAAHAAPSVTAAALTCDTCHPTRDATLARGEHGDGQVQVRLDVARAGRDAGYDASAETCAVACHARGGARPTPAWSDRRPLGCGDCHRAPPEGHPRGSCDTCHAEANSTGSALRAGPLHLNGRVDLGDGGDGCAACHGSAGSPWPTTGAHTQHRDPSSTTSVACESCHPVPSSVGAAGHLDGVVQVRLAGAALARGARATWSDGGCASVACHGEGLRSHAPTLRWISTSSPTTCGACHGLPPPPPHAQESGCASVLCHGGEVAPSPDGPRITEAGRALHIDGVVQSGSAP